MDLHTGPSNHPTMGPSEDNVTPASTRLAVLAVRPSHSGSCAGQARGMGNITRQLPCSGARISPVLWNPLLNEAAQEGPLHR